MGNENGARAPLWRTLAAWAVHLYTALGVPLGVWAIYAAFAGDFRTAWLVLAVTVFIDATDGALARKVRVREVLPWVDGGMLDNIVDYFCWVVVPTIVLERAGLLPVWAMPAPMLASGYGFAQTQAKTEDDYFLGFPSYWSLIGFYLYVLDAPLWFSTALILFLSVMVFVPIRYPYPTKLKTYRALTLTFSGIWGVCMLILIFNLPDPPHWVAWVSLSYALYHGLLTIWLWWRRRAVEAQPA
jgi:phosphatidylcholine synthase